MSSDTVVDNAVQTARTPVQTCGGVTAVLEFVLCSGVQILENTKITRPIWCGGAGAAHNRGVSRPGEEALGRLPGRDQQQGALRPPVGSLGG